MTLSSSLSNALSGLTAASRAAELVSANVANAMTPGFARREILLSSQSIDGVGAGVRVNGVHRVVDERTLADRRTAEAHTGNSSVLSGAFTRVEEMIGLPTQVGSLSDRLNRFEGALISAASRPDEASRLETVVSAAKSVTQKLNLVSDDLQQIRMEADADIASMVEGLNANLNKVQVLNSQIYKAGFSGQDVSGLLDQRQRLVDEISIVVPVRQMPRAGGQIALYTQGGAVLVDGPAAEIAFTPTALITPDLTFSGGALSGLSVNGHPLDIGGPYDPIAGGKLSAAFTLRDEVAPEAQAELDALARNLIERFESSSVDPTLAAGDPGLFTDGGAALDVSLETGLAGRVSINGLVDPESGGDTWRIRDGLAAPSQGAVGDASLITAMGGALSASMSVGSGASSGLSRTVLTLATDVLSSISRKSQSADDQLAFNTARFETLRYDEQRNGVDSDDEMQKLLLIEQTYAANARVIETLDDLMQQLLRI